MKSNNLKSAYLALAAASLIWGATGPIMKITLLTIPIFILAFIRFFTASIILFPFVRKKLSLKKKDMPSVIFAGIFGVTLNISLFFLGLKQTSALNAGILISSAPIFTLLSAHIFLKEKLTKGLLMATVFGIIGISIIIGRDVSQGLNISPIGDIFILLATLSFVAYEIITKKLFNTYASLVITFYSFTIGSLTFLPLAIIDLQNTPQILNNLSTQTVIGILYGIFFSSVSAYTLWQWALSKLEASRVGFFLYLDPISSTIFAVLLLSETITLAFILGSLFILSGVFLAQGYTPYQVIHAFIKRFQEKSMRPILNPNQTPLKGE